MPSKADSSGNSGLYGLLLVTLATPTHSAMQAITTCSVMPADTDPVRDLMVVLSRCSSCKLVQQFANTGPVAVWSEANGGSYDGVAARTQ